LSLVERTLRSERRESALRIVISHEHFTEAGVRGVRKPLEASKFVLNLLCHLVVSAVEHKCQICANIKHRSDAFCREPDSHSLEKVVFRFSEFERTVTFSGFGCKGVRRIVFVYLTYKGEIDTKYHDELRYLLGRGDFFSHLK
jgi:hypothetical protein